MCSWCDRGMETLMYLLLVHLSYNLCSHRSVDDHIEQCSSSYFYSESINPILPAIPILREARSLDFYLKFDF